MSAFDNIYRTCVGRVVSLLRAKNLVGEAEEFVNEGYVDLVNSGEEINYTNLVKYSIRRASNGEQFKVVRNTGFSPTKTRRVCTKCHEDQPIAFFGITENNSAKRRTIQPYCRDCAKKYFNDYVNADRKGWNEKLKSRYRKEADELHDNYIKKHLRAYGWKTEDITPEVIRYKRREMLAKRESKKLQPA